MQFKHEDGRTATAATPTERVTLQAMGFRPVEASAAAEVPAPDRYPNGEPSEEWTHAELDAYAADRFIEAVGTKAEKVAALSAAHGDES